MRVGQRGRKGVYCVLRLLPTFRPLQCSAFLHTSMLRPISLPAFFSGSRFGGKKGEERREILPYIMCPGMAGVIIGSLRLRSWDMCELRVILHAPPEQQNDDDAINRQFAFYQGPECVGFRSAAGTCFCHFYFSLRPQTFACSCIKGISQVASTVSALIRAGLLYLAT